MIARKQQISLQLNQLIDTLLLGGVFWLCHFLRSTKLADLDSLENVPGFAEADKALKSLQGFSPSQRLEIVAVDIVDLKHLGTEALVDAIHSHNVGWVILTFSGIELDKVRQAGEVCEVEGGEAGTSADFIHASVARPTFESLGKRPMLVFRTTPDLSWTLIAKNVTDCSVAATGLIVLTPPLVNVFLLAT